MCGIVGLAGNLELADEKTLMRLLVFDYFRGTDSTGLAAIRKNGEAKISKLSSHPIDLFQMPSFKTTLLAATSHAFIGHNRAATRGAVTTYNAHPFEVGDITGVHNGTLDQVSWQRLETALDMKFTVDSQALIAAIDKLGIEAAIKLCEEGKDASTGAWSLVWHDKKDNSLNFLRNKHRPMWLAYTDDYKKLFWASEWAAIHAACELAPVDYKWCKDKENMAFFTTEPDVWYSFDLVELAKGSKARPKPKAKKVKGREPVKVATAGNTNPFGMDRGPGMGSGTTTFRGANAGSSSQRTSNADNVIELIGSMNNPFAGIITKEKFDKMAKGGCSYCSADVEFEDVGVTVIDRDDIVLCADCSNNKPGTQRVILSPAEIHKLY